MQREYGGRAGRFVRRLIGIGKHTNDVSTRAVRGTVLVLTTRLLIKMIQFTRTIVIARLLFPNDVGLFAVAAATLGLAEMLIQPGFAAAVIQKERVDRRHLDTAWTAILIRSILIGVIAFAAAPLAATFIGTEAIVPIIRVLAVALAFSGLENIGSVLILRDVQFNRKMVYDVSLILVETIVIIVAAFVLQNAWALVIGVVSNKIATVAFSYVIHPYRPHILFDMAAFRELFGFGKWVGIAGIASYLISQGDTLAAGRFLGTEATGYYALAFGLALLPAVEIARSIGALMFPHLSRLPADERGTAFLNLLRGVFLISIPASVGLALIAEPLVTLVYGEKWLPMLVPFYVLIVYGAFRTLSYLIEPLYLSMGRPRVTTVATYLHLTVMAIAIVPLAKTLGLVGIAGAVLLGSLVSLVYLGLGIRRESVVRLRSIIRAAALPVVAAGVMAAGLITFEKFIAITSIPLLVTVIVFGAVVYVSVLFGIDHVRGGAVYRSVIWLKNKM